MRKAACGKAESEVLLRASCSPLLRSDVPADVPAIKGELAKVPALNGWNVTESRRFIMCEPSAAVFKDDFELIDAR